MLGWGPSGVFFLGTRHFSTVFPWRPPPGLGGSDLSVAKVVLVCAAGRRALCLPGSPPAGPCCAPGQRRGPQGSGPELRGSPRTAPQASLGQGSRVTSPAAFFLQGGCSRGGAQSAGDLGGLWLIIREDVKVPEGPAFSAARGLRREEALSAPLSDTWSKEALPRTVFIQRAGCRARPPPQWVPPEGLLGDSPVSSLVLQPAHPGPPGYRPAGVISGSSSGGQCPVE